MAQSPQMLVGDIARRLPADYRYQPAVPRPAVIKPAQIPQITVDMRPTIKNIGLSVRTQTGGAPCAVHAFTFLLEYHAISSLSSFSDGCLSVLTLSFSSIAPSQSSKSQVSMSSRLNWSHLVSLPAFTVFRRC